MAHILNLRRIKIRQLQKRTLELCLGLSAGRDEALSVGEETKDIAKTIELALRELDVLRDDRVGRGTRSREREEDEREGEDDAEELHLVVTSAAAACTAGAGDEEIVPQQGLPYIPPRLSYRPCIFTS